MYPCMGCRSFLTVEDVTEKSGWMPQSIYGRFNQGVVTINLVDVACSAEGDMDRFWAILEDRLELCHRALRCRHERLLGTKSDVAPILWQHGALARLKKGETIDKLLFDGYSTISLGYAGLCEMCVRMIGKSHTSPEGQEFALSVMQKLNDKCAGVESGRKNQLFRLWNSDGIHDVSFCKVSAETFWHHQRRYGQELHYKQLSRTRYRRDRRFQQAEVRGGVPEAFPGRSYQLCGSAESAEQH